MGIVTADSIDPAGRARAAVGAGEFRSLMSRLPSGVTVVTVSEPGGGRWGTTCSSVCSVSLDPPMLLVCLHADSATLAAILRRSMFAVNLLHEGARYAAEVFSSARIGRFSRVNWRDEPGFSGPHLIDDAHAIADCRVVRVVPMGDHSVVFGKVVASQQDARRPARPLLYGLRQYLTWPAEPGELERPA